MTAEEAIAIAERFVADNALDVGPRTAVHFFARREDGDLVIPASWAVYFTDQRPEDDELREQWGNRPPIVIVDEATGEARTFCYL